jgi:hypothetical protein
MDELKKNNVFSILEANYNNENHQISSRASNLVDALESCEEDDSKSLQNFQTAEGEKMYF